MTSPGSVDRVVVPAKFNTITKQVVADRGGVEEIPIPAEYRAMTVEDVVRPASVQEVKVPPKFAHVDKKKLVSPERYEWRRVVCAPGTRPPAPRPAMMHSRGYSAPNQTRSYGSHQTPRYHSQSSARHVAAPRRSSNIYNYEGGSTSHHNTRSVYQSSGHASVPARTFSAPHETTNVSSTGTSHSGLRGSHVPQGERKIFYFGSELPTE